MDKPKRGNLGYKVQGCIRLGRVNRTKRLGFRIKASDVKCIFVTLFLRVFAPPNSFLLLLYSPVNGTPEFWECCEVQVIIASGNLKYQQSDNFKVSDPALNSFP